jgi:hypothetical protein
VKIIETVMHEEGRPPENVFDPVLGDLCACRGKVH